MKVAWFAPRDASRIVDAAVVALDDQRGDARVDVFDRSDAHDFVWKHLQQPYDLCVYELADEARFAFVAGYLFHYPGLLVLHELVDAHDAIRASKVVVTAPASVPPLQQDYPAIPIRPLPLGAPPIESRRTGDGEIRFAVLDRAAVPVADLAMARARAAGASAVLVTPARIEYMVAGADVVIALRWPAPGAALPDAIHGMSAGKPVIVFETEATADWPALDPQTWQPRGFDTHAPPIVVSIDPRDEEHSLMLAIRRLAADTDLRASLGAAARDWWQRHATLSAAATAWRALIDEAIAAPAPSVAELPPELTGDGSARVRELLAPFGVSVDFLNGRGDAVR